MLALKNSRSGFKSVATKLKMALDTQDPNLLTRSAFLMYISKLQDITKKLEDNHAQILCACSDENEAQTHIIDYESSLEVVMEMSLMLASWDDMLTGQEDVANPQPPPTYAPNAHVKQPQVQPDSATSLLNMIDITNQSLNALRVLNCKPEDWNVILVTVLMNKLDMDTRRVYERSLDHDEMPTFDDLIKFLEKQARALNAGPAFRTKPNGGNQNKNYDGRTPPRPPAPAFTAKGKCSFCKEDHFSFQCKLLLDKAGSERYKFAQSSGVCLNCLRKGHIASQCNSSHCKKCNTKHHTLLHREDVKAELKREPVSALTTKEFQRSEVLLSTAVIRVMDHVGHFHDCRALLDNGSQASFVSASCAKMLNLPLSEVTTGVSGLAATEVASTSHAVTLTLKSRLSDDFEATVEALILPKVTRELPINKINARGWNHIHGLKLADPEYYRPRAVDILLGANVLNKIKKGTKIDGDGDSPSAEETVFGWSLSGPVSIAPIITTVSHVNVVPMQEIDATLRKFWELESVPAKRLFTPNEQEFVTHFNMTTVKRSDGAYEVTLPFKKITTPLGLSKQQALHIKMMFRHIWMNPECWTYLRVLWRETPKLPLQEYWLKTVTYGTSSAPAQAVLVLQTIAEKNKESHPLAHKSILRDFYMDDCMTGASTLVEALELQKQLMSVLKSANLILRKWSSSESAVLAAVPEEFRETQLPLSFNYDETVKTLGMYWSPLADDFRFRFQSRADTVKVTKRTVLSEIAKLFDPLGLMSPVTIRGKLIMQSLWKLQINWDQVLPSDITHAWNAFYRDLLQITRIRIPRCITGPGEVRHELHGFSDASEQAYAAVVYLRNVNSTGKVTVRLIASKSKVAPLHKISLPRLELCGAELLANLMSVIKTALPIENVTVFGWTDSTIVKYWICSPPHRWKTYIANRVTNIIQVIQPSSWNHINGDLNPADLPTRGISAEELSSHQLWWEPPFLQELVLPTVSYHLPPEQIKTATLEEKLVILSHSVNLDTSIVEKYSSLGKLQRHSAWLARFCMYLQVKNKNTILRGPLTVKELHSVLNGWIRAAQRTHFSEEVTALK
ncbi:unnamed protein product, partial [Allacma fusca]